MLEEAGDLASVTRPTLSSGSSARGKKPTSSSRCGSLHHRYDLTQEEDLVDMVQVRRMPMPGWPVVQSKQFHRPPGWGASPILTLRARWLRRAIVDVDPPAGSVHRRPPSSLTTRSHRRERDTATSTLGVACPASHAYSWWTYAAPSASMRRHLRRDVAIARIASISKGLVV